MWTDPEAAQFPEKEYINGIAVAVRASNRTSQVIDSRVSHRAQPSHRTSKLDLQDSQVWSQGSSPRSQDLQARSQAFGHSTPTLGHRNTRLGHGIQRS